MALTLGALCLTAPAMAQQPAAPGAEKKGEVKKADGSAWVKLCEEQTLKDDKGEKKVNVCLTHHERFHPSTGQPLISAAIRQIDNPKQEIFMVMVPLGRLLQQGLQLEIDDQKPIELKYAYCTTLGCVAEMPSTPELIASFKKGTEMQIKTVDVNRRGVGFKVPLNGFSRTLEGPPIDRKVYTEARKEMFKQIRARQVELLKRAKEQAEKKKAAEGGAGDAGKKKTQ